jgi:DNA-binding NarL/FixJ family response regulator
MGDTWLCRADGAATLTPLQHEILPFVLDGLTNAQIAEQLGTTAGSVAVQVGRIVQRLGLDYRAEIALWALDEGA